MSLKINCNILHNNELRYSQVKNVQQRSYQTLGPGGYTYSTAFHPGKNPICERVNGTLRRECLDLIILNEKHLRAVLTDYIDNYYNIARTHMSLNKDSPVPRPVQPYGKIVSKPILGGLHHVYTRVA